MWPHLIDYELIGHALDAPHCRPVFEIPLSMVLISAGTGCQFVLAKSLGTEFVQQWQQTAIVCLQSCYQVICETITSKSDDLRQRLQRPEQWICTWNIYHLKRRYGEDFFCHMISVINSTVMILSQLSFLFSLHLSWSAHGHRYWLQETLCSRSISVWRCKYMTGQQLGLINPSFSN